LSPIPRPAGQSARDPGTRTGVRPRAPRFSIDYMDLSADPAKDFYRYASGRWLDANQIPPDKARWGVLSELTDRNFALMREIMEEAGRAQGGPPGSPRRKVGDFFTSAIDSRRRDARGLRPIAPELRRIGKITSLTSFVDELARLHDQGIPALFDSYVSPDDKNSSVYSLYLYQGGLSLPDRDYYLKRSFGPQREAFLAHLERMFVLLGEKRGSAEAAAEQVMRMETILARSSKSRTALRDPRRNYHRYTIEALAEREAAFPWRKYFSRRGAAKIPYLVVGQPAFFDTASQVVRAASKGDLKVYLRWHLIHRSAPYLHKAAEEEDFDFFNRRLMGQQQPEPRWKRAAIVVDRAIGEASGQLYVERHFTPEARARMAELVKDIESVFRDRLKSVPWMAEETRKLALAKFDRFTTKIGHPEKFRDYSPVVIRRDDYLGNVLRAATFEVRRNMARIGGPIDRTEWGMTPPTVNAYFNPNLNEIVFPAGILQPPLFDSSMDDAVNLGGIGMVIGHEVTHGYDDEGRKFDAEGNLRDWWSEVDAREFEARARGITEEYSEFEPLPGARVNGMLTRGENIADLGGVRIAYEALRRRLEDGRTPRTSIDGFTPEQRFFLSYAQIWRSKVREEEVKRLLTVDPHSPARFRVLGPLVNLQEFWAAFKIPPGAAMRRPEERVVEIW
jgi:putative endopeptidase